MTERRTFASTAIGRKSIFGIAAETASAAITAQSERKVLFRRFWVKVVFQVLQDTLHGLYIALTVSNSVRVSDSIARRILASDKGLHLPYATTSSSHDSAFALHHGLYMISRQAFVRVGITSGNELYRLCS